MSQGYAGPPQKSGGGGTVMIIVLVVLGVLGLPARGLRFGSSRRPLGRR